MPPDQQQTLTVDDQGKQQKSYPAAKQHGWWCGSKSSKVLMLWVCGAFSFRVGMLSVFIAGRKEVQI